MLVDGAQVPLYWARLPDGATLFDEDDDGALPLTPVCSQAVLKAPLAAARTSRSHTAKERPSKQALCPSSSR